MQARIGGQGSGSEGDARRWDDALRWHGRGPHARGAGAGSDGV